MLLAARHGVGAAFRLERSLDLDELCAEARQQCLDRRIALEPEPALQHLHRHVAVAQMPGQPGEARKVASPRLDQWLGLGHDLHQTALLEHQRVIRTEPDRLGEVKLHACALDAEHKAFLSLALSEGQDQRVDDFGVVPVSS